MALRAKRPNYFLLRELRDPRLASTCWNPCFSASMALRAKRPNSFLLRDLCGPRLFLCVKTLTSCPPNAAHEEACELKGRARP